MQDAVPPIPRQPAFCGDRSVTVFRAYHPVRKPSISTATTEVCTLFTFESLLFLFLFLARTLVGVTDLVVRDKQLKKYRYVDPILAANEEWEAKRTPKTFC